MYYIIISMDKKITKNGTSATISLSPKELKELGLQIGDSVQSYVENGRIIIKPLNKYETMSKNELKEEIRSRFNDYNKR